MDTLTIQQINDLRARILAARAGTGEMPSLEELREAYKLLRANRGAAQGASTSRAKAKQEQLPADLSELFQ